MKARIYLPAKTAMQSGRALTRKWRLEYEPAEARFVEPLMGWTGSRDTRGQVRLEFESREAAIAYARKHGIEYEVEMPRLPVQRRRAYADNFSYTRLK
ncbi:MAG: ETC complex I subunit [Alphaproteobacteria bacterium]|nr:ETC complex I subunit [Alphaproteobacteria bacterium]